MVIIMLFILSIYDDGWITQAPQVRRISIKRLSHYDQRVHFWDQIDESSGRTNCETNPHSFLHCCLWTSRLLHPKEPTTMTPPSSPSAGPPLSHLLMPNSSTLLLQVIVCHCTLPSLRVSRNAILLRAWTWSRSSVGGGH